MLLEGGSDGDMRAIYCSLALGEPPSLFGDIRNLLQYVPSRHTNKLALKGTRSATNLPNTVGHCGFALLPPVKNNNLQLEMMFYLLIDRESEIQSQVVTDRNVHN